MKPYAIPALLIGILTFALFRLAYVRCSMIASRVGLVFLAALLAVPAVLFISHHRFLLLCGDWFYDLRALPGVEMSSGSVGAMLGIMFASSRLRPGTLNAPILAACTVLASLLLVAPFAKQLFWGMDYSELRNEWKGDICLQTTSRTCVPACIATIIRMQGGHITEPELARAAGTTRRGTEMWYMMRALRMWGYEAHFRRLHSVNDAPVPSVLGVKVGETGHVVVILAKDERGLTIGEPLRGRRTYIWRTFRKCYRPDGACITVKKI